MLLFGKVEQGILGQSASSELIDVMDHVTHFGPWTAHRWDLSNILCKKKMPSGAASLQPRPWKKYIQGRPNSTHRLNTCPDKPHSDAELSS